MAYWMGIDVGTGGTRALLIDRQGQGKAGYTAPHERRPCPPAYLLDREVGGGAPVHLPM